MFSIKEFLEKGPSHKNIKGKDVYKIFYPSSRYEVDFNPEFSDWKQYDTVQDAPYFGVWVNPDKLMVLSYAEGDWHLVIYDDVQEYNEEIKEMSEFYSNGSIATIISETEVTKYVQDRNKFLIPA